MNLIFLIFYVIFQSTQAPMTEARFLMDLDSRPANSALAQMTALGDQLYYLDIESKLHRLDPSDPVDEAFDSAIFRIILGGVRDRLVLVGWNEAIEQFLFFVDGQTWQTSSLPPGSSPYDFQKLGASRDYLYFVNDYYGDSGPMTRVWISDGTPQGTSFFDIQGRIQRNLIHDGSLWLMMSDSSREEKLYRFREDRLVGPPQLVLSGNRFSALTLRAEGVYLLQHGDNEVILWGLSTVGDPRRIKTFPSASPYSAQILGRADDSNLPLALLGPFQDGPGLWFSDGTESGTRLAFSLGSTQTRESEIGFSLMGAGTGRLFISFAHSSGTKIYSISGPGAPRMSLLTEFPGFVHIQIHDYNSQGLWFEVMSQEGIGPNNDGFQKHELWFSAATVESTQALLGPARADGTGLSLEWAGLIGERALFWVSQENEGFRTASSDGSVAGTGLIPATPVSTTGTFNFYRSHTFLGNALYFLGNTDAHGDELMVTDGNRQTLVVDLNPGEQDAGEYEMVAFQDRLVFTAGTPEEGLELWQTDGENMGLVEELVGMAGSSLPSSLAVHKDRLYFSAREALTRRTFWSWDGLGSFESVEATEPSRPLAPENLFSHGDFLYFSGFQACAGWELMRSDGTPGGAELLANISPDFFDMPYCYAESSHPHAFLSNGEDLVFAAYPFAPETWYLLDPKVGDLVMLTDSYSQTQPYLLDRDLVFLNDSTQGTGFWLFTQDRRDWEMLGEVPPLPEGAFGNDRIIGVIRSGIVFARTLRLPGEARNGTEIWLLDRDTGETRLLRHMEHNEPSVVRGGPAIRGSDRETLFFVLFDPLIGEELFATDGSVTGTLPVADLYPGPQGSAPDNFFEIQGQIYFNAETPDYGRELWRLNPPNRSLELVADVVPGPAGSEPEKLVKAGGLLYLVAQGPRGKSLYAMDALPVQAGADQSVCGASTQLQGRMPPDAAGEWQILAGEGGMIADPADPESLFEGQPGTTYLLSWRVRLENELEAADTVRIAFDEAPSEADAGPDLVLCRAYAMRLNAAPAVKGSGRWQVVEGSGEFNSPFRPDATFFPAPPYLDRYVLSWTVFNGACESRTDELVIQTRALGGLFAGENQTVCGPTAQLNGYQPWEGAVGTWHFYFGEGGVISDIHDPQATLSGAPGQTYGLRWEVENEACGGISERVAVTFEPISECNVDRPPVIPNRLGLGMGPR